MTYGELTMRVGGTAKVDFNPRQWYNNTPGVDQTLFYNRGDRSTQTVVANPCIKLGDDYTNAFNENPKTLKSKTSAPTDIPKASVQYKIMPNPDGSINKVKIDGGAQGIVMDLCFARTPNTAASQQLWELNESTFNHTAVSDEVEATARWAVTELVTKAALAQACPEAKLDMKAIRKNVATVVLGELSKKHPESAHVFAQAYKDGKFEVALADPATRQSQHKKIYDQTRQDILRMRRSFPDKDGERDKFSFDQIGSFTTKSCSAKGVTVKSAP